mmetsp:Transcript_19006/g.72586  ORF Transcript_19006/g.72586 Transcript_19006/m.72586 type:complete len:257 (-) Transcript_19006:3474-4244(-)
MEKSSRPGAALGPSLSKRSTMDSGAQPEKRATRRMSMAGVSLAVSWQLQWRPLPGALPSTAGGSGSQTTMTRRVPTGSPSSAAVSRPDRSVSTSAQSEPEVAAAPPVFDAPPPPASAPAAAADVAALAEPFPDVAAAPLRSVSWPITPWRSSRMAATARTTPGNDDTLHLCMARCLASSPSCQASASASGSGVGAPGSALVPWLLWRRGAARMAPRGGVGGTTPDLESAWELLAPRAPPPPLFALLWRGAGTALAL